MSHHYLEGTEEKNKGYTVKDRRGKDQETEVCRVCGCPGDPKPHTRIYEQPTMECVKFLRAEILRLKK